MNGIKNVQQKNTEIELMKSVVDNDIEQVPSEKLN
jgi:hypothetical protein